MTQLTAVPSSLAGGISNHDGKLGHMPSEVGSASASPTISSPACRPYLLTEELAAQFGCSVQTIRWRFSTTGSFHGVRPKKLPNRFLAWPLDTVARILAAADAGPLVDEAAFNVAVGVAAAPVKVSTRAHNLLRGHLGAGGDGLGGVEE
ncbi:putative DNA-binding protein [Burkholderia lata]|uniref:hypothetical protein n=1 Tax=Burkholderia lata (strain ATCC 17760 / DSM 23089 / LMG 22485 / NCIMB 9086 / R18194 / 383) TaxID=482957 RepID=UPI0014548C4D|nr:hypothetical protein [Burkholderia lata]VWC40699.1 putative DNA-binding protein [Burkholderia lata]